MTGPPGAGKSTVTALLSGGFERSAAIAGDAFFAFLDRGFVPPWEAAARRQNDVVLEAAASAAGRYVRGGYSVVYDGVVGLWSVDTFLAATGLDALDYVVLLPPRHLCLDRVRSRVGHGFADLDAAAHMYGEFADARVDARHVVTSVSDAPTIAATILQTLPTGALLRERASRV
ncbi:AAA family ATPase [Allobranchiibius sp. GilTou73]|uniref:AAA family ATPase n=1 Tax=Allobranchiibius sp. GilTou73 TaxID=2904523 RepID=UPI001F3F6C9E|nr:AAA family ATPase [Allobranchiibius sp. GilTou73]UIJ35590.1 AAA family ATPase [Allobranchiibius sp. GilTou73]